MHNNEHNNLKLAVLGFVAARPGGAHGYVLARDLSAVITEPSRVTTGAVYRMLAEMEREGLVELELIVQNGRPNRKTFHATDDGRRLLKEWIDTPLPEQPKPLEDEFSVRLLLQPGLNLDTLSSLIEQQRSACAGRVRRLGKYRTRLTKTGLDADALQLFFDGVETQIRARMSWLEEVERFVVRSARTRRGESPPVSCRDN